MRTESSLRSHRLLCLAFALGALPFLVTTLLVAQAAPAAQPSAPAPTGQTLTNVPIGQAVDAAPAKPSAGPLPAYEVATIKPAVDTDRNMMMFTQNGVSMNGIPLQMILREAFNTEDDHIVGAPSWVKSTRYDIEAKVSTDDVPKLKGMKADDRKSMLVSLMADRFNLKYHHETREMTTYSLVVAKGGLKMKASAPDPAPPKEALAPAPGETQKPAQMKGHMLRMEGPGKIESEGTGTGFLAHLLAQQLGKTVVDKTGLTGGYDYTLQWTPDNMPPPGAGGAGGGAPHDDNASDVVGPSLFTALEEQLGLKLESGKGPVDVIVIDHIEAPSAN
jgi:uncharacterized protein (TIGR03435 family)